MQKIKKKTCNFAYSMTYSNPTYTSNISFPHQGSIVGLMTPTGTVVEEYAYDAWGKRRNSNSWCYDNTLTPSTYKIDRGYTGHEHLDEFQLINMNGRLYDPLLGRMLSPDNFIQAPNSTQSFNRFSYCLNNPLLYTDPTGEEWVTEYRLPMPTKPMGSGQDGREQFEIAEEWKRYIESAYTMYYPEPGESNQTITYFNGTLGTISGEVVVVAKAPKTKRSLFIDDSWAKGLHVFGQDHDWLDNTQITIESIAISNKSKEKLLDLAAKSDASINNLKYVKGVKVAGKILGITGVAATGYEIYDDTFNKGKYYSAGTKAAVLTVGIAATAIPFAGWAVAGGIGLADAIWGDQFYNYVETYMKD